MLLKYDGFSIYDTCNYDKYKMNFRNYGSQKVCEVSYAACIDEINKSYLLRSIPSKILNNQLFCNVAEQKIEEVDFDRYEINSGTCEEYIKSVEP